MYDAMDGPPNWPRIPISIEQESRTMRRGGGEENDDGDDRDSTA